MSFSLRLYAECDRCSSYTIHVDTDEHRVWRQLKAQGWEDAPDGRHICPQCARATEHFALVNFPVKIDPV
jgi:hypothetical protein